MNLVESYNSVKRYEVTWVGKRGWNMIQSTEIIFEINKTRASDYVRWDMSGDYDHFTIKKVERS